MLAMSQLFCVKIFELFSCSLVIGGKKVEVALIKDQEQMGWP